MDAVVANVSDLKDKSLAQFLLNIQCVDLSVGSLQVVLDARHVERRLRSASAESRNPNAERYRGRWYDCDASRGADWIQGEPFFKVIQRDCVVVDAEACPNDCLASMDQFERRGPSERDAWSPVVLRRIVESAAGKF